MNQPLTRDRLMQAIPQRMREMIEARSQFPPEPWLDLDLTMKQLKVLFSPGDNWYTFEKAGGVEAYKGLTKESLKASNPEQLVRYIRWASMLITPISQPQREGQGLPSIAPPHPVPAIGDLTW